MILKAVVVALAVSLSAFSYFWLRSAPDRQAQETFEQDALTLNTLPDLVPQAIALPDANPEAGVSVPEASDKTAIPTAPVAAPIPPTRRPMLGMFEGYPVRQASLDMNRAMTFAEAAGAVAGLESARVAGFKQHYGLSDEEFKELLDYWKGPTKLMQDQINQDLNALCAERANLQDLEALGAALKQIQDRADALYEKFGREAETGLRADLFLKINNQLVREPPRELPVDTNTPHFAAMNNDLKRITARVCPNDPTPRPETP